MVHRPRGKGVSLIALAIAAVLIGSSAGAVLATCGPFADVSDAGFCPFVLEIFYLGITTGTTPTTYDPASNVSRLQMAAFLSRTVDRTLQRASRRTALEQLWAPQNDTVISLTTVGIFPQELRSDGQDVWVANYDTNSVSRVRGADGKLLETWTGATNAFGVLAALGKVFVSGSSLPGRLYRIDPGKAAGAVETVASTLADEPLGLTFDGARFFVVGTALSIVTPGPSIPWTTTTVTTGFSFLNGAIFDGTNVWITDSSAGRLMKINSSGAILQTVTLGGIAEFPVFDGTSLWVPNSTNNVVSVVRASTGVILTSLTGNGLNHPLAAAFDGQRVLVTNRDGDSVSLWKAADLTPLGVASTGTGTGPTYACSDGVNFWITLQSDKIGRF